MPLSLKNFRTFKWLIKLFKFSAIFIITVVLLVSLILIFLPTAVSTQTSKQFIENQISNALDRPVSINQLDWSWSDGIIINNLEIPDSSDFSENSLVSLEHVTLKLNVKQLLHREVNLELLLNDLNINIIKNSSGKLNIETLGKKETSKDKPPALPEEKDEKKKGEKPSEPLVLPLDVSAEIRLKGINVTYDDRSKPEKYIVKDLEIKLEAPSVKSSPINLAIGVGIQINDQTIPRATLSAFVKNLFDADGALNINGLFAGLDVHFPGIVADIRADMAAADLKGKVQINLASVMQVATPLIPDFPSPTNIKGSIELIAVTGTKPNDPLAFDATLSGSDLEVSGKVINGKSIGPGNFSVHLNGMLDLNNERLDLATGEIRILENSHINAFGRVEQFKQDNKEIHLAVSPLVLDINELTSFAHPFIPPSVEIDSQGKQAAISLKKLKIDGLIPEGQAKVLLDGLKINLPKVVLKDEADGKSRLQVSGIRLNLEKLAAAFTDLFPESAALKISLAVDKLINGKAPNAISVSGIRLDYLTADALNIQNAGESKFKVECNILLDNRLNIKQIEIPDLVQIQDLDQSLKINAALRPNETIIGSLDHLDVTCKKVSVLKEDIGPMNTGINIHLALKEGFLKNLDPINLDIKNFFAGLKLDDAVVVSIVADAVDTANTSFKANVKIDSDLEALIKKIPSKLLPPIAGAGNLSISLNAVGRRPDIRETDALKKKQFTDNLAFIDQLNFRINIENGAVKISNADQNPITVESITASPLISYELFGKTGKGDISSSITAGSLKGLPGINSDIPVSGKLSLSGSHEYVGTIDLEQSLSVAPAGIDENIHITIDGLDRMITQSPLPPIPQWISKVGADIAANIKISDCAALKAMGLPGLSETTLDGLLAAGVAFNLIPDQSVDGSITLTINNMNVALPETLSVEKIDANIDFSKSYLIQSAENRLTVSGSSGLSLNVIDSAWQPLMVSQNMDIYRHIRLLHERMNPNPALSFQKADVVAAPFPLIIDESMVMLNLDNGLPNLDYFQFNLLGGTINGSVALRKKRLDEQKNKNNQFNLNTALTFSGINTAQIFPRAFSKDDYSKADISGAMYADFPVTDQLQRILENMSVTVEFTRIGSRALERILYAMDPYESNEAIVSQRLLLKNGSPKKIRLDIKDGFLSLRGKISIKGFDISLPAIRRLNIALIPGLDKFEDRLSGLLPLIDILRKISAEYIVINKQTNAITFD